MSSASNPIDGFWPVVGGIATEATAIYLLVDHAGATGLMPALKQRPSLKWRSLFEGSKEDGAMEVAPILVELVPIGSTPSTSARSLVSLLCTSCATSHALLWMRSQWHFDGMAKALTRRLDAQLPDNMSALLRYFDTRIFESLLKALSTEQAAAFLGAADRWSWLDRAGKMQHLISVNQADDLHPMRLELSVEQESALIDGAQADFVIHQMRQVGMDLCKPVPPADLHQLVTRCLHVAHRHGIDDTRQQALFCLTELELGPNFHEQPGWSAALKNGMREKTEFAQLLRQMEDQR